MENTNMWVEYIQEIVTDSVAYIPTVIFAGVILVVGWFVIRYIEKAIEAFFEKTNFDEVLEKFTQSFLGMLMKVALFVLVISILGVKTSSFIAVFGAMVFTIGLALQGSLSNFAGGVLILIFKPFKIGHYIDSEEESGKVVDIQIFNTILEHPNGKRIVLPNALVSNKKIINHSSIKNRRLDLKIGISYDQKLPKVKKVLEKIAASEDRLLENKGVKIVVNNFGENSVEILFRIWTKNGDYWDTRFDILEKIKIEFDKAKIEFPNVQRDVHLYNQK